MNQIALSPQKDYLDIEQTTALKGLLALGVLLSHVVPAAGVFEGSILSPLIGSLGYLCVAVFFFLSGYGITVQHQRRKERYIKDFLKDRILSIYLLTLFLVILYDVFHILMGVQISRNQIIQSLLFGNTIVSNGWYLQVIVLFYFLWYITVKYIPKENMQFPVLSMMVVLYMVIGMLFLHHFWFQSSLGFLLGIYWGRKKHRLDAWLLQDSKRAAGVLAGSFAAFCITYVLAAKGFIINMKITGYFRTVMSIFTAAEFVVVLLMLNICAGKIVNSRVFRYLGTLSMEIYVLQGIALHFFKVGMFSVENGWLYIACVMIGTMLLATVMHPIVGFVINIPKKYL